MRKEYSYKLQSWSILLGGVAMVLFFVICVVPPFLKNSDRSLMEIIQNNNNLYSFVIALLTTAGFSFILYRYLATKKNNHKFVITDLGIVFPPKLYLKDTLTIPYSQIRSVEKVLGGGAFALNINTEVGEFNFPEMNFETKDVILEAYDLIKSHI